MEMANLTGNALWLTRVDAPTAIFYKKMSKKIIGKHLDTLCSLAKFCEKKRHFLWPM
jgi:hypothetical protein